MVRNASAGLMAASGLLVFLTAPATAQVARQQMPAGPDQAPLVNNPAAAQQKKVIGFKVLGANGQVINNGQVLNPGANLGNIPANNPNFNNPNFNPAFQGPFNPYGQFPGWYGGFGNPYMYNPYYSAYYNPYLFLNTGYPVGTPSGFQPMHPAQLYNLNLNYQYLTNPNLNPLSNPAFSGPFSPGPYTSLGALQAMGINNILSSYPLNPSSGMGTPLP